MVKYLINWDKIITIVDQISIIKVFISIVSSIDDELKWYSNIETRAKIEWRWQLAASTVKVALTKLTEISLITTTSRGIYQVNKKFLVLNGRV